LAAAPGQYVDVEFAGIRHGAHPFTVIRSHPDGTFQIAVKASGNDTTAIHARIATGARAWVHQPRGDFHYRQAGERQVRIAAGIGITPFLSWIPSLPGDHEGVVDLWYSVRSLAEAPFLDELTAAARTFRWLHLHLHLVVSQRDGRLTARRVLAEGTAGRDASAFLRGPPAMVHTFARALRTLGLTGPILHEAFSPR
jgi:predicted ferric reductase